MEKSSPTRLTLQGGNYNGQAVGWPFGVDSFSHPLFVDPRQLRWMENAVLQGAFAQVRPGYRTAATFDTNEQGSAANEWWIAKEGPVVHPQMCVAFTPTGGTPQLVFAISGSVFFCAVNANGSLGTITPIRGFQFNRNADVLVGCRCVQTATIVGGLYQNNVAPRNLLVIQDGVNRAGIWDGTVGVHMNPTKKVTVDAGGNTLYPEAYNQTRIGLWMAWSGNRLWVFDGPNGYASDPNDPTHFTEELNLQSFPRFVFPEEVTGAIDRGTSGTSRSQVVVFTHNTTWTLWSGILNRLPSAFGAGWQFTDDFQTKIFDSVGCVAGKSAVVHRGLLYWKSQGGVVLFDSAQTVNSSQNLPPIDSEMAYSKMRIAPSAEGTDLTCAGRFENFVWWSVPVGRVTSGRRYNAHTQVLDRQTSVSRTTAPGTFSAGTTGWQGVWSGIRPVEWASVKIGGRERVYAISLDSASAVRIWEAFQANRADNGRRIPWLVETRLHAAQPKIFDYANFRHFRLLLDQIGGNVDIVGSWRGLKGGYHELLNTRITATPGTVFLPLPQFTPVTNQTEHYSLLLQGRTLVSPNHQGPQACGAGGVESAWDDGKDHAFALALRLTGRAAISAYMIAVDSDLDTTEGTAQEPTGVDETGFNLLAQGECPEHVAGTTPDYMAAEQPAPLVSCPYLAAQSLTLDYIAPTP